jgi:hypothetical protein
MIQSITHLLLKHGHLIDQRAMNAGVVQQSGAGAFG